MKHSFFLLFAFSFGITPGLPPGRNQRMPLSSAFIQTPPVRAEIAEVLQGVGQSQGAGYR